MFTFVVYHLHSYDIQIFLNYIFFLPVLWQTYFLTELCKEQEIALPTAEFVITSIWNTQF